MKSVLKSFCLSVLLFFSQINLFSQNESQVVSLTVTSQGGSQEEAKNNALRNAIQQTIGVFISANSTILNDNLVKDEIVSISNGTIQKYQILNEGQLNNNIYFVTLNADVSVTKLNSFIENKGVKSSFNGSLFSFNIKQKELATINEAKAFLDLKSISDQLLKNSFEYDLKVGEPKKEDDKWLVPIDIKTNLNSNFITFYKLVIKTMELLSLPEAERKNFTSLNMPFFEVKIDSKSFFFRNEQSVIALTKDIFMQIANLALDITIINKVKNINIYNEFIYNYHSFHIQSKSELQKSYAQNGYYNYNRRDGSKNSDRKYVKDFYTLSNFNLISHGRNPKHFDIYQTWEGFYSNVYKIDPTIDDFKKADWIRGQEVKYNYIEYFYDKQPNYNEGRRFDKELLKIINLFIKNGDELNFKFEFSNSQIKLKFDTEEISKLDGFEIKKN